MRLPVEVGDYEAVILVEHEDGLIGLGEAPVVADRGASLQSLLADLTSGQPPRTPAARFAVETARLDLQAQREGRLLAELLGGVQRRQVECSALVTAARPDLVARDTELKAAGGFASFKLKACNGGGMLDQERLGAARWAAGYHGRLRLDLNGRLGPTEAAARLPSLTPFRLELIEQPLPTDATLEAWRSLARAVPAPLAADESLLDAAFGMALAEAGVGVAMKLATVGGLPAARRLAACAQGPLTIGSSFETSIGLAAALHLACALEREPLACGLATGRLLDDDIALGLTFTGAHLQLPVRPGLGVVLDRRALGLYRVDR